MAETDIIEQQETGEFDKFVDEQEEDEEDAAESGSYRVSSYGADYTVEVIAQRLRNELIVVPDFQRAYVWSKRQASRFIESLLLGLPVPGIFLDQSAAGSGEPVKHVIDGQQRLRTLEFFLDGKFRKRDKFRLVGVCERWNGKSYQELSKTDQQRIQESIIHATIFKQEQPAGSSSMYHIYERLNTGGTKLAAQEIRACFMDSNDVIRLGNKVNDDSNWRRLFSSRQVKGMKDQELILRFWAGRENWQDYKKPMKLFLNSFCEHNPKLSPEREKELRTSFSKVVQIVLSAIGEKAFRPGKAGIFNTAVFDAVMIGLYEQSRQHEAGHYEQTAVREEVKGRYEELLQDSEFRKLYEKTPNDREHYTGRIRLAIDKFRHLN